MKRKIQLKKKKRVKYYAVYSKHDNFLHGVFPPSSLGLISAKNYITEIDPSKKNYTIKKF